MQQASTKIYVRIAKKYRKLSVRLKDALQRGLSLAASRLRRRIQRLLLQLQALQHSLKLQAAAGMITLSMLGSSAYAANQILNEDLGHQNPLVGLTYTAGTGAFVNLGSGLQDLVIAGNTITYYKNVGSSGNPVYSPVSGVSNPFNGLSAGGSAPQIAFVDIRDTGSSGLAPDFFMANGGTPSYYENTGTPGSPVYTLQTSTNNPLNVLNTPFAVNTPASPVNGSKRISVKPGAYDGIAFADVDGNGTYDFFVGSKGANVQSDFNGTRWVSSSSHTTYKNDVLFYKNTGTATSPTFVADTVTASTTSGLTWNYTGSNNLQSPVLADIDNSGTYDYFVAQDTGAASVGRTPVSGSTMQGSILYYKNVGTASSPIFSTATAASANPLAAFDNFSRPQLTFVNLGSGLQDAFIFSQSGSSAYYKNIGSAGSPQYQEQGIQVKGMAKIALGDVTDSGKPQALVLDGQGKAHYYVNEGTTGNPNFQELTGTANPFNNLTLEGSAYPAFLKDGSTVDLVVDETTTATTLLYFKNTGSPSSPNYTQLSGAANPVSSVALSGTAPYAPAFVDLRNAGVKDLVVGTSAGNILYFKNIGTPSNPYFQALTGTNNPFNGISTIVSGSEALPQTFAFFDENGDTLIDALITDNQSAYGSPIIDYCRNTGSSTAPVFTKIATSENPFFGKTFPYDINIAEGDLDGDNAPNVLFGNALGNVRIYTGEAVATATPTVSPTKTSTPSPTSTNSPNYTPTPSFSASPTANGTFTVTPTFSDSPTKTVSPSDTPSSTPTPTWTPSPSASPSFTHSPTASPTFSISPTPTESPLYAASNLGKSVLGPVPVKKGQPLRLYFDSLPAFSTLAIFNVSGQKVGTGNYGAVNQPEFSTSGIAPGLYFAEITVDYPDGTVKTSFQKIAIVP